MEVVVTTGAIRRAKLQSNVKQQTNTQFFTGQMSFLSPYQQCQSTEGKNWLVKQNLKVLVVMVMAVVVSLLHPMVDIDQ